MTVAAGSAAAVREAEERLRSDAAAAWHDYLDRTRELDGPSYVEVEAWAWQLLQERLNQLAARYRRLRRS